MEQGFDVDAMIERFRKRADAVRQRGLPPVEGTERQRILRQIQLDFQDFAIVGDADGHLEDGVLTLRVDLRPKADAAGTGPPASPDGPVEAPGPDQPRG